jgi:hypothetical protein
LEFKNTILEEKLSNELKNGYEKFSSVRVPIVWDFFLGSPKIMKFRDYQGSLTWDEFFMTICWTIYLPK